MYINTITKKATLFAVLLVLLLISQSVFGAPIGIGKWDITQPSGSDWVKINFPTSGTWYKPVAIIGPPTYNGSNPATMRVKDLNASSFKVQIDEWNYLDGSHVTERVDIISLDLGYQDVEGMAVVAGKDTVNHEWKTVRFGNFASPPVILAQCSSYNGSDAVTVRIRNVTKSTFEMKLQEEEANGAHTMETVTWAAFEVGKYKYFEVKRINNVTDKWFYVQNGANLNDCYILAGMQTYNGGDTAALRVTRNSVNGNFSIKIEEEQSADSETGHTGETIGLVLCTYNCSDDITIMSNQMKQPLLIINK